MPKVGERFSLGTRFEREAGCCVERPNSAGSAQSVIGWMYPKWSNRPWFQGLRGAVHRAYQWSVYAKLMARQGQQ